jgi:hypothetical protein
LVALPQPSPAIRNTLPKRKTFWAKETKHTRAAFNVQRSTFNVRRPASGVRRSADAVKHSPERGCPAHAQHTPSTPALQLSSSPALQHSSTPALQLSSTPALQLSTPPTLHSPDRGNTDGDDEEDDLGRRGEKYFGSGS